MAQKKTIQLPKEYLSYSQIQLWKNDPKRYIELYFNGRNELRISNSGMEYGKVVAEALEKGIQTGDLLTDAAMLLLPKYDIADQEIRTTIKTEDGCFDVIGRPDSMSSATKDFLEYKTGKGAWTAKKAQKHPQMVFYAMLIYLAHKVVLPGAKLIWIQTEDQEIWDPNSYNSKKVIKPTGRVENFDVYFTLQDILGCMAETIRVAKEIEIAWVSHVKPPEDIF